MKMPIAKLRKLLTSNTTAASFTQRVPTATKPATTSNALIVDFEAQSQGTLHTNVLLLLPYATAADDVTFSVRVLGWNKNLDDDPVKWIPRELAQFACTAGNIAQGAANTFLIDTVTVTHGVAEQGLRIVSNAGNEAAFILLELPGVELLEIQLAINSGTATAINAYYGFTNSQL